MSTQQTEATALVEEFRALRAELTARIEKQQDITNFAIAIVAGLFALARAVDGKASSDEVLAQLRNFFPWISIILSSFTLMTLDHEMNIAHLTIYIYGTLRPRIVAVSATNASHHSDLWEWSAYRARWQQHAGSATALTTMIAGAKYVITLLPNVLLTVAYWRTRPVSDMHFSWTVTVYALSVVLLLTVIATATYTSRIYLSMEYKSGKRASR